MPKQSVTRTKTKKTGAPRAVRSGSDYFSPRFRRVSKRQIQWAVERLVQALDPEKIILFGSYAYGKPNRNSDVDMLVIKDSDERWTVLTANAYRAVWGKTFPMDILVRTPAEIAHRLEIEDWFITEIVKRGKVLYERRDR
jgi:predicted nucleotidyltransferase